VLQVRLLQHPRKAKQGSARQGMARPVFAGQGMGNKNFDVARQGVACRGIAWLGSARLGPARLGQQHWEDEMAPFDPAGAQARWKILYELLKQASHGDFLSYAYMGEALGLDPDRDRGAIVGALRRAAKELEEKDKRAIKVVPNKGYRVVAPKEHLALAQWQQKRVSKALVRGHSKVVNVDLSKLDPEARAAFDLMAQGFARQMDFNRRAIRRLAEHGESIARLEQNGQRSEVETQEIRRRLEWLEAQMAKESGE
jgi:hypothetical protein